MRYFAIAIDYDGTLAAGGVVEPPTVEALRRLKLTGRRLVLVTGRLLEDVQRAFPAVDDVFDRVVVENGAVVWTPAAKELQVLDEPPPEAFLRELRARGVEPIGVGRVIVSTCEPHETAVIEAIRALGLELQVEFNKGAVMVLPAGVTKRTGLAVALDQMRLSPHNIAGIGDAENDHAFLATCECRVAVANALPQLAERADWVTGRADGAGVAQLVDRLVDDDLASLAPTLARHRIYVGQSQEGESVTVEPYGESILVAGPSGSGKTTIATALLERISDRGYQVCVVDPEGDHEHDETLAVVGSAERAPSVGEIGGLLSHPRRSVAAMLLAVPLPDRPGWFSALLAHLLELRAAFGRPHWIVVDEAHHVLPPLREDTTAAIPRHLGSALMVTVDPERLARAALEQVDVVITSHTSAEDTLASFARSVGRDMPALSGRPEGSVVWRVRDRVARYLEVEPPRRARLRHMRKYARGDVGETKSFVFRGPTGALHLRAQNLTLFMQMADGVDDSTWMHHLRAGDYSRWFREAIKDDELADEASRLEAEARQGMDGRESRRRIREAIDRRYTLAG